jgi:hydroxymethylpyrimidine/phosphomethylpyrimidine kinase
MPVSATKTGMLANASIVRAVAEALGRVAAGPVVVDPVMVAKSGDPLLDPAAEREYVERLFPRAALVTPNLHEAARLVGRPLPDVQAMVRAARELLALGPAAVLVKGGARLAGDAVDVYCDRTQTVELRAPRIETPHTHGAGCTLSAAIAARLALGAPVLEAVRGAKDYLTEALRSAYPTGRGRGPLDHLHPLAG